MPIIITTHYERLLFFRKKMLISLLKEVCGLIIDYKLKNINEEDYVKQLHVYSDYVKNITKKDVKLYLYSILEKSIKEII